MGKSSKKKPLPESDSDSDRDSSSSSSSSSDDDSSHQMKPAAKKMSTANDDSDDEEEMNITINRDYAKAYQDRKQLEELRNKRDDDSEDSDSEDSESDDEEPTLNDENFLKTMQALRNKDASIYDRSKKFYDDEEDKEEEEDQKPKHKPKRYKDVVREQILEQMSDDDDDEESPSRREESSSKYAYDQDQKDLRSSLLQTIHGDDEDDSENDDLLKVKRTVAASASAPLAKIEPSGKTTFEDPRGEVPDGEQFLLDYIQNQKWVDRNANNIIGAEDDPDDASVDSVAVADDFESQYNFRFELAASNAASGAALSSKSYARGSQIQTLRRPDDARKAKRQARAERKAAERKLKEEKLRRLKNAKKLELDKKLKQIKSILGSSGVDDEDDMKLLDEPAILQALEGDFDPEKFEQAMQSAYGDEFYQQEDAEWKTDADVREFAKKDEELAEAGNNDDLYDDGAEEAEQEEGDGYGEEDNEDYYDEEMEEAPVKESALETKIKEKLQEDLYKLDFEDIVAGMPTRFKYREVPADDFGLSTEEILMARDSTLKQFVSLKRMAPYQDASEAFKVGSKRRRKFRDQLKAELESAEEQSNDDAGPAETEQEEEPKKKRRRRIKKSKKKEIESVTDEKKQETKLKDDTDEKKNDSKSKNDSVEGNKKSGNEDKPEKKTRRSKSKSKSKPEDKGETSEKKTRRSKSSSNKKKSKKSKIAGVDASRLSSYGL